MGINGGVFYSEAADKARVPFEVIVKMVWRGELKLMPEKFYSQNKGRWYALIDPLDLWCAMNDGRVDKYRKE